MTHTLVIFSQSDNYIKVFDTSSHIADPDQLASADPDQLAIQGIFRFSRTRVNPSFVEIRY